MEPLAESVSVARIAGQVARQVTYASDLCRLLRPGGERGGQEATRQRTEKDTPIHHSMT
jgi:hypothetical protein